MQLKALPGIGNPTVRGVEIKPGPNGIYEVSDAAAIEHMLATGFVDANAKPAAAAKPADDEWPMLRSAIVEALKLQGVMATVSMPAHLLARALMDSVSRFPDKIADAEKRGAATAAAAANEEITALTERAVAAEKRVVELEAAAAAAKEPATPPADNPPQKA